MLFAIDAYQSGYALAYNPAAVVWHYHFEPFQVTFERCIRSATLRAQLFGVEAQTPRLYSAMVRIIKRLLRERRLSWPERWFWLKHNLGSLQAVRRACLMTNNALRDGNEALDELVKSLGHKAPTAVKRPTPRSQG